LSSHRAIGAQTQHDVQFRSDIIEESVFEPFIIHRVMGYEFRYII
jgi:hypothetical protein